MTCMIGEGKNDDVLEVHAKYKEALRKMHSEAQPILGRPVSPLMLVQ